MPHSPKKAGFPPNFSQTRKTPAIDLFPPPLCPISFSNGMPFVSIITPLHNKGPYIYETICSVQAQTLGDWEMIIVENGSSDNGQEIARELAASDPRIKLLITNSTGPGKARNVGLAASSGEWVLFLDADDLIEPDYLEKRMSDAGKTPGADIVAGPWKEFANHALNICELRYPDGWVTRTVPIESAFCFPPWVLHATMVRRNHVEERKGWNEPLDDLPSEDCAFWFSMLAGSEIAWSDHSGALYRKQINDSRDSQTCNPARAFEACRANIRANEMFLRSMGHTPSANQAATAARMMRRMLNRCLPESLVSDSIRSEIRYWLGKTAPFDLRMLFWRLYFTIIR